MTSMLRGILGKRVSYSDFTIVAAPTNVNESGKENAPAAVVDASAKAPPASPKKHATKHRKVSHGLPMETIGTNQEFDKLLDDLQIPPTLRPKLEKMDLSVKASMLKSSQTLAFRGPNGPAIPPSLRRTRSIDSIDSSSSRSPPPSLGPSFPSGPDRAGRAVKTASRSGSAHIPRSPSAHARVGSVDIFSTLSRAHGPAMPTAVKPNKDKGATAPSAAAICKTLASTSSTKLEVDFVKRLRICLRNEAASWSQDFLRAGGYSALMTRLRELLEVEWREEQHDDQILHELLRCFKALSTSSIGCFALRSSSPSPFVQLVALLYSDKKPGEVGTRNLIVELLLTLFDLYPSTSLPAIGPASINRRTEAWDESAPSSSAVVTLPAPHKTFFSLIRAILLTPAPPPTESPSNPVSPHAFIESLHKPRIYKSYLQELSDICRDYFWVFCHQNNTIWNLEDTDESKVEKPRAPGGMTGGVEFEAMGYMTTHFKLINAIAKAAEDLQLPKDDELSAHRFHTDLFLSGLERIILIGRKASTVYYPTLHLEIARYMSLAGRAGYEIPWSLSRMMGPPPSGMCKPGRAPREAKTPRASPTKKSSRATGPVLPSPVKIEPIRLGQDVFGA